MLREPEYKATIHAPCGTDHWMCTKMQDSMKSSARLLISNHATLPQLFVADRVHKYRLRHKWWKYPLSPIHVEQHRSRSRQKMGHGMPDTWSESWNIHPGCLSSNIGCLLFLHARELLEEGLLCAVCPLIFWEEGVPSRILSFRGKLFQALSRGSDMLLNKNFGFRCSEILCNAIWEVESHL